MALPGINFAPTAPVDLTSTATSGAGGLYGAPIIIGNTAPNFGAIVQPFLQPPEHGGYGMVAKVPGFTGEDIKVFGAASNNKSSMMIYGAGAAVLAGLVWLLMRRK